MPRKFFIYLSITILTVSAVYLARAAETGGFRERLLDFIEKSYGKSESVKESDDSRVFIEDTSNDESLYNRGDWSEYTSDKNNYNYLSDPDRGNIYSGENVNINTYGSADYRMKYGKSFFAAKKYKQFDEDKPTSRVIEQGFLPEQVVKLHAEGNAGDRISVYIDHDSTREENIYIMKYHAINDDEIIREVNAGEIDINFNHSKYAVYDNSEAKGLGVDITLGKNNFFLKAFGSITKGEAAVEYFKGNTSSNSIKLSDFQYVRKSYYQLEPFIRYDGVTTKPSGAGVYSLITVTSAPASPSSYSLSPVNISPEGFELYIDDQNQYNNYNAIKLSLDGGYYTRLINGTDYTINYTTGVIKILKGIPDNSRIFAVYKRTGGTLDPCAVPDGDPYHPGGSFAGKTFVFIKYGYSINEDLTAKNLIFDSGESDRNGDGRVNIDVYEIRSYYYLGSNNIVSGNLAFTFLKENSTIEDSEKNSLSPYKVDYSGGIMQFNLREPFRQLLGSSAENIYSESTLANAYLYSRYIIQADYAVEARSFQLQHTNIIEKSVKIKINGRDLPSSLYSVDYTSGYLAFTDSNNPVIGPDTQIEVRYEYLPLGQKSSNFVGGLRGDYNLSKDLRIGGSALVSRNADSNSIPDAGAETEQTLLLEGDASLKLTQKRLTELYRSISGGSNDTVPAELSFYAEYAKSVKDINTFGKALIDNMESSEETVSVSLSEKDWILSSMPAGFTQSDRGVLNYYFYRDPGSPGTLKGPGFTPYKIDYSVKPGPFNIATGHVADKIIDQDSQRSLVFDFDFTSGSSFSVVTRKLSGESVDLSGMQYVEVWFKYEGSSGNDYLNLFMELGSVNEDSDGDGVLDTEDANANGYIDSEPSSGYSEDRGYSFNGNIATKIGGGPGLNSSTLGDGILNTEDLNGNGTLDTTDSVYRISLGTIGVNGGGWQKVRIYIDRSALTSTQLDILKTTKSLRFFASKNIGTKGRLFIDSMKLITSKWRSTELDGTAVTDPDRIKITLVNSINDSDYRADSFLIRERNLYESLYGNNSTDDIEKVSESALQVEYSIPSSNQYLTVTRRFTKPLDLRHYNTLNAWINSRTISSSYISFILGSSDNDYIEFRTVPSMTLAWEELTFRLTGKSSGAIDSYSVTGTPDMRRIRYLTLKLTGAGTSGKIWFNDIYVSEPEKLEGDAKWYECQLKILKPLVVTDSGTPVMSDIDMKYIYKGISSSFSSLNRLEQDISEKYHEVLSSVKILPNWDANADYIYEHSVSDSLDENLSSDRRGDVSRNMLVLNSVFASTGGSVPSVSFNYSLDRNRGDKDLEISGIDYEEKSDKTVHSPVISWTQEFSNFLFGKLIAKISMKMLFSEDRVNRDSAAVGSSLSGYIALKESEKKQQNTASVQFDYSAGNFYLNPAFTLSSSEVVEWEGKENSSGIIGDVEGNYHIPFWGEKDMKYLLRNNGAGLVTGYKGFDYIAPEYSINIDCRESGFADYSDSGISSTGFSRSKNSVSTLTTGIKIPVLLKKFSLFDNVRFMQINYSRSLTLTESDVPYEGEGTDYFSEEYGISRVLSEVSPAAFNLFRYYPGKNFAGRGNFAGGRDLIYETMNEKIPVMEKNSSIEYDNALKLTENFSADISISMGAADLGMRGGLGQICERGNLYGIPNQVVTAETGFNLDLDLMKIFSFGFFRSNTSELPYHASTLTLGAGYTDSMMITENIDEKKISPNLGLTFKIDRCSFGLKGSVDLRRKKKKEFIDYNLTEGDSDYIYVSNMEGDNNFRERDTGYKFTTFYETDVKWIYEYFSTFYKLTGLPIFSVEYIMEIDRYDYTKTVSPEPYDLHMLKSDFTMDLHKNVKGGMSGRMSLEKFRNRENNGVSREVISYEISGNFSLVF